MPTDLYRRVQPGLSPAGLNAPASYRPAEVLIGTMSECALGYEFNNLQTSNITTNTWTATNRVLAFMFEIGEPFLVQKVWRANGATGGTDNMDLGVYNEAGTTLLVNGGSTLVGSANVVQEIDCTDTLLLAGRYWMAGSQNGTTATVQTISLPTAGLARTCGAAQFAGAVPLGSTFTPAAMAGTTIPMIGIAGKNAGRVSRYYGPRQRPSPPVIHLGCRLSPGAPLMRNGFGAPATGVSPWSDNADFVLAFPFVLEVNTPIYKVFWQNGSAAGGASDVGVYDENYNLIASTGAGATGTGASIPQMVALSPTPVTLPPGLYYCGMTHGATTTNQILRWSIATSGIEILMAAGCWKSSATDASPLATTPLTPADITNIAFPLCGLITRTVFDL